MILKIGRNVVSEYLKLANYVNITLLMYPFLELVKMLVCETVFRENSKKFQHCILNALLLM